MLWLPMIIMLGVTMTALIQRILALVKDLTAGNILQLAFAVSLMILGLIVAVEGLKKLVLKEEIA